MNITPEELVAIVGMLSPIYYSLMKIQMHVGRLAGIVERCKYCQNGGSYEEKKDNT